MTPQPGRGGGSPTDRDPPSNGGGGDGYGNGDDDGHGDGNGNDRGRGPPVEDVDRPRLENPPGRAHVDAWARARRPDRVRARYRQGEAAVEETFARIDTSRGAGIVELHYPDGRYVTVNAGRELDALEEAE